MTELHVRTPFVAPGNEYFFDAGGDGNMRIKRCQDCSRYIHPPKPVCDKCRSSNVVPEVVSGKGILFGYSVNVHFSMPGLPPPPYITGISTSRPGDAAFAALSQAPRSRSVRASRSASSGLMTSVRLFIPGTTSSTCGQLRAASAAAQTRCWQASVAGGAHSQTSALSPSG